MHRFVSHRPPSRIACASSRHLGARAALVLASSGLATLAGCGASGYGGATTTVTLASVPTGATCYVIPQTVWAKLGEERMLADAAAMARQKIAGKTTDCEVELPQYASIFVAEKDGARAWVAFTPRVAGRIELTLPAVQPVPVAKPAAGSERLP